MLTPAANLTAADVWIRGLPYMVEGNTGLIASSANPFAPRQSGGGDYRDFSMWSALLLDTWQTGVGQTAMTSGGYLYGEADSRVASMLILPHKTTLGMVPVSSCDPLPRMHPIATDQGFYLCYGDKIYLLTDGEFVEWRALPYCAVGVEWFTEGLVVAYGEESVCEYYPFSGLASVALLEKAETLKVFGGLLYLGLGNKLVYTNSIAEAAGYTEEIPVGGFGEHIVSMAGMWLGSIANQQQVIATQRSGYVLLIGDIVHQLLEWPTYDSRNGFSMINHFGDAYVTVSDNLYRITQLGDIIPIGLNTKAGLPCNRKGPHVALLSLNNYMLCVVQAEDPAGASTVWAWGGEGWSFMLAGPPGYKFSNLGYDRATSTLFVFCDDGNYVSCYAPDDPSKLRTDPLLRYQTEAVVDLGFFDGAIVELPKCLFSLSVYGCLSDEIKVLVEWAPTAGEKFACDPCLQPDWQALGTFTTSGQEIFWIQEPVAPRGLRLRITLTTEDDTKTPVIDAIRLKYQGIVSDYRQWQVSVRLDQCLRDRRGDEANDYTVTAWDANLRAAIASNLPFTFVDIDGDSYQVMANTWARRVFDLSCDDNGPAYKAIWTLGLLQVYPPRITA